MNLVKTFIGSLFYVKPSRLIIAISLTLLCIALLDPFLRFGWIGKVPLGYILRDQYDDQVYATASLSHIRNLPPNITPIYVFGGSGTRESIQNADILNDIIKQAMPDKAYKVFMAATWSRNFSNDITMLELLQKRPGIIIYGIAPNRFVFRPEVVTKQVLGDGAMGLNGHLIDFLKTDAPELLPTGSVRLWLARNSYIFPAARLLAERIYRRFARKETYVPHIYKARAEDSIIHKEIETCDGNLLERDASTPDALPVLMAEYFFKKAKEDGHKIVMIEQPLDIKFINGRLDESLKLYTKILDRLVVSSKVDYLNFQKDLNLPTSAFADRTHIFDEKARVVFMTKLASELANWIQKGEKNGH